MLSLAQQVKRKGQDLGAAGIGICPSSALFHNKASLDSILPRHRSVVSIMFPHSETALISSDIYVKQYDTIFCYNEMARIGHKLARWLDSQGYQTVAVPAFLPLDMKDEKLGMVGAVDWKEAAVLGGLATWGKSGLVVNPLFGPRIRLGGLVTTAELQPDEKLDVSFCNACRLCIDSCPAGALSENGEIDKKRCGDYIFSYGLRAFTRLLVKLAITQNERSAKQAIYSRSTRELWQALETGNYYSCWTCQSVCPVGKTIPVH